jgi:hypothetical protein
VTLPGTIVASIVGLIALLLAAVPAAGAAVPIRGDYSGTTAAGAPFSMNVSKLVTRKPGSDGRKVKVKRTLVGFVKGAVPISCASGEQRSQEVGFPGPLHVKTEGAFSRTGIGSGGNGRVTTKVVGRYTGKRAASGSFTYRGGFFGESCTGEIAWTATRE